MRNPYPKAAPRKRRSAADKAAIVARMQARAAGRSGGVPKLGVCARCKRRLPVGMSRCEVLCVERYDDEAPGIPAPAVPPAEVAIPRVRRRSPRAGKNALRVSCDCRSVRVFPSALAMGDIRCEVCGSTFA